MLTLQYFNKYFNRGCAELTMYFTRHDFLEIEEEYICPDDFCLGKWIREVREAWDNNELTVKQIRKLEMLGLAKNPNEQTWEEMYKMAARYYDENRNKGSANETIGEDDENTSAIPMNYKTEEGILLGAWADRQKKLCLSGSMSVDKEVRLEEIGIVGGRDVNQFIQS